MSASDRFTNWRPHGVVGGTRNIVSGELLKKIRLPVNTELFDLSQLNVDGFNVTMPIISLMSIRRMYIPITNRTALLELRSHESRFS